MTESEDSESQEDLENRIKKAIQEEIQITSYRNSWPSQFAEEKKTLLSLFPEGPIQRIEHFGSTAVPGLDAKPVIDMLVEVSSLEVTKSQVVPVLKQLRYDYFWRPTFGNDGPPFYCWFIKRDPKSQVRTTFTWLKPTSKATGTVCMEMTSEN